jgi:four helix bundle protein
MTAQLPVAERFGLQSQMRRSAVSVLSNFAEGAARDSRADFSRFLAISMGSLAELEVQCALCEDLGFLPHNEDFLRKIRAIRIMLAGLRRALLSPPDISMTYEPLVTSVTPVTLVTALP